ncbi:hypothetical protein J27TS7_47440 [Paenibacillus dendritiformis]|nr:hypothetical protein J27TS7_47440 [Paenibacillus dendritiformis]
MQRASERQETTLRVKMQRAAGGWNPVNLLKKFFTFITSITNYFYFMYIIYRFYHKIHISFYYQM